MHTVTEDYAFKKLRIASYRGKGRTEEELNVVQPKGFYFAMLDAYDSVWWFTGSNVKSETCTVMNG